MLFLSWSYPSTTEHHCDKDIYDLMSLQKKHLGKESRKQQPEYSCILVIFIPSRKIILESTRKCQ